MITSMESVEYITEEDADLIEEELMWEETLDEISMSQKFGTKIKTVVDYPKEILIDLSREEYFVKASENDVFKKLEEKLKPFTENLVTHKFFKPSNYINSLLILDQLDLSLKEKNIKLPENITAIDVGCGRNWFYANALYDFLKHYDTEKPRDVSLEGIDPRTTKLRKYLTEKRSGNRNIQQVKGNVLNLDTSSKYDFVFSHKMLTSPGHFKAFGLNPMNLNRIMDKCRDILTPEGVQVTIGYQMAGEYWRVIQRVPIEKRIAEFNYEVNLGDKNLNFMFTPGDDRQYRSGICISKK